MKTCKPRISVGKKPESAKSTGRSRKDEMIREKYITKITGKSPRSLKANC